MVGHRTRHGRFASYFKKHEAEVVPPVCHYGAVVEPRHLTVCPRYWKITRRSKKLSTKSIRRRSYTNLSWERDTKAPKSKIGYLDFWVKKISLLFKVISWSKEA